jgi:adenylate cyclase
VWGLASTPTPAPAPRGGAPSSEATPSPGTPAPGTPAPGTSAPSSDAQTPLSGNAPSIAVLPFVNRSRDEDDEYFSDGLAEELLNVLTKIRGLRVAARASSFLFKGSKEDLAVIGERLNVATLLDGSVRKSGNRVRISVQLVKAADRVQLWSETYDRSLDDIFAVQDDIAQAVVKELRTTLLGEAPDSDASGLAKAEVAIAARGHSSNPEAHRLYLQGKHFVDRITKEDTERGIRYLEEALALDPSYALAWADLSRAHNNSGGYGWVSVHSGAAKAREAALRALELAPDLAEAHVRLAIVQRMYDWDWRAAEASTRRALELAPGSADVLRSLATLTHHLCRFEEAEQLIRRAIDQDPLNAGGYNLLGQICRSMGRLHDAERAIRKALELSPGRVASSSMLATILAEQGRDAEARAAGSREPAEWARLTALAYVHHLGGRREEALAALGELEAKFSVDASIQIACIHAAMGDVEGGFHWLERAIAERDAGADQAKCEPTLRALHGDPRWPALLKKIGLEA